MCNVTHPILRAEQSSANGLSQWNNVGNENQLWRHLSVDLSSFDFPNNTEAIDAMAVRLQQTHSLTLDCTVRPVARATFIHWLNKLCDSKLKNLAISGVQLNDHCGQLSNLVMSLSQTLESLCLRRTLLSGELLVYMSDMPHLKKIDFSHSYITDDDLALIPYSLWSAGLEEVWLDALLSVTAEGMTGFLSSWKPSKLKYMSLRHNSSLYPSSLEVFVRHNPGLSLSVRGSDHFTVSDIRHIQEIGKCCSIDHNAVLEDWSVVSLRRFVDYLVSGLRVSGNQ